MRLSIVPVNGLDAEPIDMPLDRVKVATMAKADLDRRMSEIGSDRKATVDCGRGFAIVTVGGTFDCKMTSGPTKYRLEVLLQDTRGTVKWRGVAL
jgi:hypothetical protein